MNGRCLWFFGVFFSIMQSIFFMISDGKNEPSKWVFNYTMILGIINQTKEGCDLRCYIAQWCHVTRWRGFHSPSNFNFTLFMKRWSEIEPQGGQMKLLSFFSENLKTVANCYWEAVFYIFFMQKNSKYTSLSLLLLSDIKAGICEQKKHFVAFLFQVIIILQVIIIQLHHLIELLLQSKCLSDL